MSSADLTGLLQSLTLLSLFLILGMVLRAKLKIFQNTFLPASVIGGFLLLILGPQVLNLIPIPEAWSATYASMPGVLIVPVVTAVPLGLSLSGGGNRTTIVAKCFWASSDFFSGWIGSLRRLWLGIEHGIRRRAWQRGYPGQSAGSCRSGVLADCPGCGNHDGYLWTGRRYSDRHVPDQCGRAKGLRLLSG